MNNYLGYTQQDLKMFYENGYCYILRYKSIDKLYEDKGIIKAKKIYKYITDGVGIMKRNRHCFCDLRDLNYWKKVIEENKDWGTLERC